MATLSAGNRKSSSCSNCRYRKVKCDRKDKLAAAGASQDSQEIRCTQCESSNIPCALPIKVPKTGKRIREILERGPEGVELISSDASSIASSSRNRLDSNQIEDPSFIPLPVFSPSSASELLTSMRPGLFGVPGLTRRVLEGCISAYWRYTLPCYPSIPVRDFWTRLGASFSLWSGDPIPDDVDPLSDLLILALACPGAGQLEIDSNNEALMERKFVLQADILKAFFSKVNEKDVLKNSGLDGVEACYMISTMELELKEQICWPDEREAGEGDPSLDISPYSCEGALRLGFKAGIHRRETRENLDEDEIEMYRRKRFLFACLLSLDACRALIFRRPQFLVEGSFEHDVDSLSELAPESERYIPDAEFYRNWTYSINELSFMVRDIHSSLVTQKVKDQGILPSELLQALERLEGYHRELPDVIRWEKQLESHPFSEQRESDGVLRTKLMSLFLEGVWFSTIIAVWYAVEDVGFRSVAPSSASSPSVKSFRPAPRPVPFTTSSLRMSKTFEPSDPRHLARISLSRLDSLMTESVERWCRLMKQVNGRDIIRASAPVFRGTCAAGMLWCCERVNSMISSPDSEGKVNVNVESIKSLIGQAVDFLDAVRACDSSRNTPALCERLNEALQGCKTALSNVRIENRVVQQIDAASATPSSSTAPTSTPTGASASASLPSDSSPEKQQSRQRQRSRQDSASKRRDASSDSPSTRKQQQAQQPQPPPQPQPAHISPSASTPSWVAGPSSNPTPLGTGTPLSETGAAQPFYPYEYHYAKHPSQFNDGSNEVRYSNNQASQLPPMHMRAPDEASQVAHWAQSLPYASSPVEAQYFPQYAPSHPQPHPLPRPQLHSHQSHPNLHSTPQLHHSYPNPPIQVKQEYPQEISSQSINYSGHVQMHPHAGHDFPAHPNPSANYSPLDHHNLNQSQQSFVGPSGEQNPAVHYARNVNGIQDFSRGRNDSQDQSTHSPSALSNYSNNSGGNNQVQGQIQGQGQGSGQVQVQGQNQNQNQNSNQSQYINSNGNQQQTPDTWLENVNFNFNFQ